MQESLKDPDLYLVIMAGGSGTRFWPKSNSKKPKQLLSFEKDPSQTLLRKTIKRFECLVPPKNQIIVTTQALQSQVLEQAPQAQILAEPQGRNTAPCIFWAAKYIASQNPNGVMLVMPSDHVINDTGAFIQTVELACQWAKANSHLITLGVKPIRPETGYGYLKQGEKLSPQCQKVAAFVEKPNHAKAEEFFRSKNYLWNGGMFIWRASVILEAFATHMPEMAQAWEQNHGNIESAYPKLTASSIDYGVMEKAKNVVTFTLDCGWDDLGSWVTLEHMAEGGITAKEFVSLDSSGNIIDAPEKCVAVLGVKDLIVADHGGCLLIAHKSRAQDIRKVVEEVKKRRPEWV